MAKTKKTPKKTPKKKREAVPAPDAFNYVTCPECGHDQGDMGRNVLCEECELCTMPWYDSEGKLHNA